MCLRKFLCLFVHGLDRANELLWSWDKNIKMFKIQKVIIHMLVLWLFN